MQKAFIHTSFKLAGLRSGRIVYSAAAKSRWVRWAIYAHLKRKQLKHFLQQYYLRCVGKNRHTAPKNKLAVLLHVRGGIGDVAMSRALVLALRKALPQAEISFCYNNQTTVSTVFPDGLIDRFQPYPYVMEDFDVVLSGCHLLMYDFYNLAKIKQLAPTFEPILQAGLSVQEAFKPFAQFSPHLDGELAAISVAHGGTRITNLGWFSGLPVTQNDPMQFSLDPAARQRVLAKLGLADTLYLTIHDGINTQTRTDGKTLTRGWPHAYWEELVSLLKHHFPQIAVVQLGGPKSTPFPFVDKCLVGKTTVPDLPYILSGSVFHIDGESGMVHLANLTQTPCCVFFGPSDKEYLGYARNLNLTAPFCGGCMNILPDWMSRCVLNFPKEKQCLSTLTPKQVFQELHPRLQTYLHETFFRV